MSEITARFSVDGFDPSTIAGIDGDWVGALVMRKTYSGALEGTGLLHFVSSGTEENRGYLAAERIVARLDGVDGEVTVHHGALNSTDDASAFGYIIPGTGTGAFADWRGTARILHDEVGPRFVFSLDD